MKIYSGNAHPALAKKIADHCKTTLGDLEINRFPDGEIFVKIKDNIRGEDAFVVQPICYPPNENFMELLIIMDAMRRASAERITAVLPFYGYARQDRKDQPRVPITAKLVANLLVAAGASRILTMDLHAQQIQGFFDIPVDHLYAAPILARRLIDRNFPRPVIVSPDTGGVKMAQAYAHFLECGLAIVAKERRGPSEVDAFSLVGSVEDKTAIMVDDLSTTAGTLCSASRLLKENGALDVVAAVSHAPLVPQGLERLKKSSISELFVTDSVPLQHDGTFPVTTLSVSDLLGEAILRIHEGRSVSSLFKL